MGPLACPFHKRPTFKTFSLPCTAYGLGRMANLQCQKPINKESLEIQSTYKTWKLLAFSSFWIFHVSGKLNYGTCEIYTILWLSDKLSYSIF